MRSRSPFLSLLPEEGFQSYMALLLLCGVSMLFAIPFAARVSQHTMFKSFFNPSLFFIAYAFLMTVVGVRRGSAVAHHAARRRKALAAIALQVLLAQVLVLPYLIYVRAVLTASEPRIALISAYALFVAFVGGLVGYRLERLAMDRGKPTLLLKTVLVLACYATPFVFGLLFQDHAPWISLVSPIGAVLQILERGSALSGLIAFAVPAAIVLLMLLMWRHPRKVDSG